MWSMTSCASGAKATYEIEARLPGISHTERPLSGKPRSSRRRTRLTWGRSVCLAICSATSMLWSLHAPYGTFWPGTKTGSQAPLHRAVGLRKRGLLWTGTRPCPSKSCKWIKFIRGRKTLSKAQISHLDRCDIPNYQWSALDVSSRFKLITYSREKSWTNGLCWYLYVISWLRSPGVQAQIVFTVDHGEEFGGRSWLKVAELRRVIGGSGCRLIQNHKGHCEENAHVERTHRTDDDEFYTPRVTHIHNEQILLREAMNYVYYHNNVREHFSLGYETPFARLKRQLPEVDDSIRAPVPILLDKVAVHLGRWGGYNVLAEHNNC